eukprot:CAMPEP_0203927718 /NCGR_PEP_ID=MMETSP0359-20131031/67101_1 /ASSEMBLY_ACC=CAM_ASM_000338 /TAXON_ID=268821 /ORGANISM="Scrippsiella Hangoei, Strain SHTV-5" /LENGTH=838 /DNA_ID=CAMNT_0050856535 /DNA_START=19 /DNA_END=2535 /DNA_ORIENTATION=-
MSSQSQQRSLDTRQGGLHEVARAPARRWHQQQQQQPQVSADSPTACVALSAAMPAAAPAVSSTSAAPPVALAVSSVAHKDPHTRPRVYLVWHKQGDLRLHDHEPLSRAHLAQPRLPVLHLHVFESFWFGFTRVGHFPKTGALRAAFWVECVADLRASLRERGQDLCIRFGCSAAQAVRELAKHVDVFKAFAVSEVCSEELALEADFERALADVSGGRAPLIRCWSYTLHHVEDLEALASPPDKWITPYLSFGAFKRQVADSGCRIRPVAFEWQEQVVGDGSFALSPPPLTGSAEPEAFWGRVPSLPELGFSEQDTAAALQPDPRAWFPWRGGESAALARLEEFIWDQNGLRQYVGTTDWSVPGKCAASRNQTSKLSPYLAFGCLSPRFLYWEALRYERKDRCKGVRGLINSLLWRDFYRFTVYYAWGTRMFHLFGPTSCGSVPGGHREPTKWCCKHYNNMFGGSDPRMWTWGKDREKFRRWTDGTTGYPFVDAAMLELKATGFLHHLSRETVGWFFNKDFQLDWRLAAEWFESCLVDYDCVLNWGNWVYFILTQLPAREDDRPGGGPRYTLPRYSPFLMCSQVLDWGSEHDPTAAYVKKWLPQLQALPVELAREPWRLLGSDGGGVAALAMLLLGREEEGSRDDGVDGEEPWACGSCTLQNEPWRRTCDICGVPRFGSRRALGGHDGGDVEVAAAMQLGVYAQPPIVPPPPDQDGDYWQQYLDSVAAGAIPEEDGRWDASGATRRQQGRDMESSVTAAAARGWALLPASALPLAVGAATGGCSAAGAAAGGGLREDGGSPSGPQSSSPLAGSALGKKKGTRWAVRGERSTAVAERVGA